MRKAAKGFQQPMGHVGWQARGSGLLSERGGAGFPGLEVGGKVARGLRLEFLPGTGLPEGDREASSAGQQ